MGHAISNKYFGSKSCNGASCTESVVEHMGVDEGFAMIIQRQVGGASISALGEETVEQIMNGAVTLRLTELP